MSNPFIVEQLKFNAQQSRQACSHPVWDVAIDAGLQGASTLQRYFRQKVAVTTKGIGNFVSEADLAAEKAVVDSIRNVFPDHAIISEESHQDRADSEHLWIIDPLDGTNNFLHGLPQFAVSIGYYHNGNPEVGVICNPASGDWYVCVLNQGAWANGSRVRVSDEKLLSETLLACGFYYDRGKLMHTTLETLADFFQAHVHGIRRMGAAALDLAALGCGHFGLFFEYKLSPWDYAAGHLFVTEAGGIVTDCDGSKLPLDRSSSICASNGTLHKSAMQIIAPHWLKLHS